MIHIEPDRERLKHYCLRWGQLSSIGAASVQCSLAMKKDGTIIFTRHTPKPITERFDSLESITDRLISLASELPFPWKIALLSHVEVKVIHIPRRISV